MQRYAPYLDGLAGQSRAMADLVLDWVRVPTATYDLDGLARMAAKVKAAFAPFAPMGATVEELELNPQATVDSLGQPQARPLGKALRFRMRPDAPLRIFLGIHMDVVYGNHGGAPGAGSGAEVTPEIRIERGILHASGGADAKGGLVILLKALEAFEASPFSAGVGWEVLINPDEEIGSPGSKPLLIEAAGRNHLGLLFEPSLPNGNLVGARKGSGNFAAVVRGKAAHAGRDPHLGRNAIHALAHLILELDAFGKSHPGVNVNVGKVEGGGPLNRVPDLAIGRFNLRVKDPEDQAASESFLRGLAEKFGGRHGVALELSGGFSSPPKPLTEGYRALLEAVRGSGRKLGMDLGWESSGGVSDGNKLAAAGLVNVDTLGAVGGNIHSPEEFLILDSLAERARLTALLLMELGSGESALPEKLRAGAGKAGKAGIVGEGV